ncbi:HAD family phosphatase, partial [Lactobacillus sp. XV13L]|nr:HAD family phosphatase [Lactobacillus sp. XV13L]
DIVRSFPEIIEINIMDASKGNALVQLADRLGIAQNQVMVFGDQGNDVSMFANPDFKKVAMGNAIGMIKESADYVTDDNDHDGSAKALKKFVL